MKLKHEKLLINFAFNFNLRHYSVVAALSRRFKDPDSSVADACVDAMVGRCRFTPG